MAILLVVATPSVGNASCIDPETLNKRLWMGNDGGTYRVRDVAPFPRTLHGRPRPHSIWWVGTSKDNGKTFINIFKGFRRGNVITGEWSDVHGAGRGTLELVVDIHPPGPVQGRVAGFRKTGGTGDGFGGSEWRAECDNPTSIPKDE
ncbi:MAG: hypothetical protein WCE79_29375 [Xanthobacteraceae bacterium]